MYHARHNSLYLCIAITTLAQSSIAAQTVAPQTNQIFQLPLADGTSAEAVVLPSTDSQTMLIYAAPTGKLGIYTLKPARTPNPPTPPTPTPPQPPPTPTPTPQALTIAIIEDVATISATQRQTLASPNWRRAAGPPHTFAGVIPADVVDPSTGKPPASLQPFFKFYDAAKSPQLILLDANGAKIYAEKMPLDDATLTATIKKYGG